MTRSTQADAHRKPSRRMLRRREIHIPDADWAETASWRHDNLGRHLHNSVARFQSVVLDALSRGDFPQASFTHLSVTRNLDITGTRITELARRAGISKQAMGQLVLQCEKLGLVQRDIDKVDQRAVVVFFTPLGLRWLDEFRKAVQRAEAEMVSELSQQDVDHLRRILRKYGGEMPD